MKVTAGVYNVAHLRGSSAHEYCKTAECFKSILMTNRVELPSKCLFLSHLSNLTNKAFVPYCSDISQ